WRGGSQTPAAPAPPGGPVFPQKRGGGRGGGASPPRRVGRPAKPRGAPGAKPRRAPTPRGGPPRKQPPPPQPHILRSAHTRAPGAIESSFGWLRHGTRGA